VESPYIVIPYIAERCVQTRTATIILILDRSYGAVGADWYVVSIKIDARNEVDFGVTI
jgi:hypothetical protein